MVVGLLGHGPAETNATEKLSPVTTGDGCAFVAPELVTIFISFAVELDGVSVPLAATAEHELKLTPGLLPKFASGSTPLEDDGASAIHSAEDLAAPEIDEEVLKVQPCADDLSVMVTVN
jgi:hypothetical protein